MSVAVARTAPARAARPIERSDRSSRPLLRIVGHTAPEAARVPYFALCAGILLLALLGALGLNTSMAATAYTIRDRTITLSQTQQAAQTLATQVELASSPTQVMAQAAALGLVPSAGVTYLSLADSTLVGGGR